MSARPAALTSLRVPGTPHGVSTRREVWQLAANHALFAVAPLLYTLEMIAHAATHHAFAVDFHQEFWPASHRLLHGLNPYDRSWQAIGGGVAFPYPALTAVLFVPLAALPRGVADYFFLLLMIAACLQTLRVLGVRDWRLYGAVLLFWPAVNAWQTANLTLLLGLALAYAWRERERPFVAGLLFAVAVSLKPFIWPIGLWLLATRRYAALGWAVAAGVVVNVIAWAIVGVGQISSYEHLVSDVTAAMYRRGYTVTALALHLHVSHTAASVVGALLAVAAGCACLVIGRRGLDGSAFSTAILTCLLATPVLWNHYFALLIVPLAIARPRYGTVWAASLLFWVCPAIGPAVWQIALGLSLAVGLTAAVVRRPVLKRAHAGSLTRPRRLLPSLGGGG